MDYIDISILKILVDSKIHQFEKDCEFYGVSFTVDHADMLRLLRIISYKLEKMKNEKKGI